MANTAPRVTELDFDQISNNLKEFLKSQNTFSDYDFEGSGLSILIDLLAYNTFYQSYYLNMVANEMFIDSAQLRSSIVSLAKSLNYVPSSMKSATSLVNIQVTPSNLEDQTSQTLTLPRFTNFQSQAIDGTNFNFVTVNSNSTIKVANTGFLFSNVTLKQGDLVTKSYLIDGTTSRFMIPSSNVDTDYIYVGVQASATNTAITTYNKADDLTELKSNSAVYFIEENPDANGNYILSFGDGVLGQSPANNSIVTITYLNTSADLANKANSFILLGSINGYNDNVIITPVTSAAGGAPRETIEEVRFRAPIAYTSQNRAVTVDDYNSLILKDYPNIDAISVWGGADNDPPVYGKVFISLKPVSNFEISTDEKNRIITEIISNRSVLTVTPEIVDPDYSYLQLKVDVNYDPNKTTLDVGQLRDKVRQTILAYKNSDLHTFNSVFRKSKLQTLIDSTDNSFTSSSVQIFIQKRALFTLNQTQNYTLNFLTSLKLSEFPNQPFSFPAVDINDLSGISRQVFYEVTPRSDTGIDSIEVLSPGSGYTVPPTVTITGDGNSATAVAQIVNGKVTTINIVNQGIDYSRATVSITGGSGSGATASATLSGSIGTIRSFYYLTNGQKQIVNTNAGTINFTTGVVTFTSVLPIGVEANANYDDNIFTFSVQPEKETIMPLRNQILDIDENDSSSIVVNMIAE